MAVAALLLAGCGSSSGSSSTTATTTPAPSGSSTSAQLTISATKGSGGMYLTGASGRALYVWAADSGGKSSCSGACASTWPPVTTSATPAASGSVQTSLLGTITRADGSKQVTYKGHPLYYYAGDPNGGTTKGQGSNSFGAKWWLIAPSGAEITGGSSSSSSSGSSSGGGWG